ncbi:MAG: hypothetical protein HFI81_08605 [Eubacterium sp.]|jgi:hypothetical protein|nr:hypothetical protein [Eubacterium sp.]
MYGMQTGHFSGRVFVDLANLRNFAGTESLIGGEWHGIELFLHNQRAYKEALRLLEENGRRR